MSGRGYVKGTYCRTGLVCSESTTETTERIPTGKYNNMNIKKFKKKTFSFNVTKTIL